MHVVNNHKPDHRLVTSPHVLLLRTHAYYPPVNVKPHLPQAGQRWGFANFNCEMPHPSGKCCSLLIPTPQDRELTQIFFSRQFKCKTHCRHGEPFCLFYKCLYPGDNFTQQSPTNLHPLPDLAMG